MKKLSLFFGVLVLQTFVLHADTLDLFILAGQSNAQGWQGNAQFYPKDSAGLDAQIPFYWVSPGISSSQGKWATLKPQGGRFPQGHFGLEISLARSLKKAGYHPAVFKYSLGATSIIHDWKGPGDGKLYDKMKKEYTSAVAQLKAQGHQVRPRCFIWIQGESDAQNLEIAQGYKARLQKLLVDLRNQMVKDMALPIILGVDEQHPWVKRYPQVITAQKELAQSDPHIQYTSMIGLEKADTTHLTPRALGAHGERILKAFLQLANKQKTQKK